MAGVTLRDVAAAAGVSVATVSKVVTGRFGNASIPPHTVERVRAVVTELGYVPNALGRGLQARQTGQLGVVLRPFPESERTPPLLALDGALLIGLSDASAEHHLPGFLLYVLAKDEVPPPIRYLDGRIDGLLVRSALRSDELFLSNLDPARLPLVTLWCRDTRDGAGYADVDHRGGAQEAVAHLLTLGHRRIAVFGWDDDITHFPLRYQGYCDALRAAGIEPRPEWHVTDSKSVLDLMRISDPVTAAFALTDTVADILARDLLVAGVHIPSDFSLVGFDNIGGGGSISGGLTTVDHPVREMTLQGVRNLLALIRGAPANACRSIVPTHLVVRHSTAALEYSQH